LISYASYLGTSPSNFSQLYLKMTGRRAGRIRPAVRPRISPRSSPRSSPRISPRSLPRCLPHSSPRNSPRSSPTISPRSPRNSPGSARWESGTTMDRAWNRTTNEREAETLVVERRTTRRGSSRWEYGILRRRTTSERASGGAGMSCAERVLECRAWDDTQGQLGV
jgi:hypothetical protein